PRPTGHPGTHGYYEAGRLVIPALAATKHPAFAEEREWRLLIVDDQPIVQFRVGSLGLIPYVVFKLAANSVVEVIVGPGSHADVRLQGVKRLLESVGLGEVPVRPSAAPYRS